MNGVSHDKEEHRLLVDTKVYSLEAIKKAAYKLASKSAILITLGEGTSVSLLFNPARRGSSIPEDVVSEFCIELLDQDLREIVKRETTPVRNLILAHAFSRTSLIDQG